MSLLFVDSFDHSDVSNVVEGTQRRSYEQLKWLNNTGYIIVGEGRRGSNCFSTGYTNRLLYGFGGKQEIIFGCAIWQNELFGSSGSSENFLSFGYDEDWHIRVAVTDSGAFVLNKTTYSSAGNPTVAEFQRSRDGVFHIRGWYYLELRMRIGDVVTGGLELRINGEPLIEYTGNMDLQPTVGTRTVVQQFNWIGLGAYEANKPEMRYDDVYLCDTAGSTNNDFLGDVRVDVVYPTANSSPLQFTASTPGADNYTMVNETNWDTSTMVSSATVGHQDLYVFGDVTSSSDVYYGIQINAVARKSDAGLRKMKILTKSGGVIYKSDDYYMNESSFIDHLQVRETNPATGTAWTDATINAALFGVEVA